MRRISACIPIFALALTPALAGCNKIQARVELKKGNAFYMDETYREALAQFQKGLELDPSATFAWRSAPTTRGRPPSARMASFRRQASSSRTSSPCAAASRSGLPEQTKRGENGISHLESCGLFRGCPVSPSVDALIGGARTAL